MQILPRRIELANDVPVQRPQHPDPGMHQKVVTFGGTDQAVNRCLPLLELLLSLRGSAAYKKTTQNRRYALSVWHYMIAPLLLTFDAAQGPIRETFFGTSILDHADQKFSLLN